MKRIHHCSLIPHLLLTTAALLMAAESMATPYVTSVTNNAGTVSFRLNQTTGTNDTVLVISSGGAVTNTLQAPSADPAKVITRGLVVTNLGIAAGTVQVYIKHTGSGQISTNSPRVTFNSPRGIAVNTRPSSPYFGWTYVANSAAGSQGDGMFALSADLSDALNQGTNSKTAGYNFASGGASAPFHTEIAPDDSVLVTDWSDASGNVIAMDPLLNTYTYVLKPINGTTATPAVSPVGTNNNHGSISSAVIVGTGANRVLYTMDEDYQTDPTAGAATEWNSVWRYDIGNSAFPYNLPPSRKIMSPFLTTFSSQNQKIQVVGHYLYANQRRSNPPQHSAYIVDLNNLMDPSTFTGVTPWGAFWTSQDASLSLGYSDDVLRDTMSVAVSPDGKWFAAIIAGGSGTITAPNGDTFANAANDVIVAPMDNGVPNLAAVQRFKFGGAGSGRDLAFDAAHNIYAVSSGLGYLQSLDIGESAQAITGSDGTFTLQTPATLVTVIASQPLALEQGTVPGVFTLNRTGADIANPLTVSYTITGSASNGVDYAALPGQVTFPAGQGTVDVLVTPIDDTIPELTETVVLTLKGAGEYTVSFPLAATVSIADNETPQLQIVSLSTNIYQGNVNDYATLRLRRFGQTNAAINLKMSDFAFGGTAVQNVDFRVGNLPLTIPPGVVDYSVKLLFPVDSSTEVGSKSIILTNLADAGYTVSNNTATSFLTLKTLPTTDVLFSDDFEGGSSAANWAVLFGTIAGGAPDYNVIFGYDYSSGKVGNLSPIPPAPHSFDGSTHGLYMTVNKSDDTPAAAALNLYLKNHAFSGDYALRFDMFLVQNSSGTQQSKNETALFGINHSGALTNWIRNSVPGTGNGPAYNSDGLWCTVEADASTTINFGLWSGPTYTNTAKVVGPTNLVARTAATTTQIFKKPPFDAGPAAGGVPANTVVNPTPTWVEVEVSQIGNAITWKMNNTVILSFVNTNVNTAAYNQGTIMLGYNDPWDDIGNSSANSGEASVIFDNVQVVSLPRLAPSLAASLSGTNVNLTFPSQAGVGYVLEYKGALTNGVWNTFGTNSGTGGSITVGTPHTDAARFYRLRLQ